MSANIFISYGHNNFDLVVSRLANDLRKQGFNVFLDIDYLHLGDWEKVIDNHLKSCQWMIFIVSKRSVDPSGYCLNELCRAGELNMSIIPVCLDDSLVPLSINRLQRIMMQRSVNIDKSIVESYYNDSFETILNVISGNVKYGFADDDIRLKECLKPINNNYDLFNHYLDFCGRKELFEEFEDFLEDKDMPIMWLKGNPGIGKTAFSSALCWRYPEIIGAIHFCKFNNSDRSDPKKIITSLIYQLASIIPDYKSHLLGLIDLDKIFDKNPSRIFEYLLIEPLSNIKQTTTKVIIIDALDECTWGEENEISNILLRNYRFLPKWLKIFITARNEIEVSRTLSQFRIIDKIINNDEDLKEYFIKVLPDDTEIDIIDELVKKSDGSFLYATEISKEIRSGRLTIDNINVFPNGIYGYFTDCFDRLFSGDNSKNVTYEEIKPLLELLTISQEPITIDIAMDYLACDEYQVRKMVSKVRSFFPLDTESSMIHTLHKSVIDWLLNYNASNRYYISKKEANNKLLKYLLKVYELESSCDNVFVIKKLGPILIELGQTDKLISLLKDKDYQMKKIKYLHLDTGLVTFLKELSYIYNTDKDRIYDIYSSDAFNTIFSTYRRQLYNYGLFFNLKSLGFTTFINNNEDKHDLEFEIGKVFYYYIVELFEKAIKCGNNLIKTSEEIKKNSSLLAEVYNVIGLSLRKVVRFDDAIDVFSKAIEYGMETEYLFEVSMAYLILSKIKCRMLKFLDAKKDNRRAISKLEELIECQAEGDEKLSNILFLAEEKRVYADLLVWSKKFEEAQELLEECERIYTTYKRTDRYYIRFKYTSCFLEIMKKPSQEIDERLNVILTQVKQGKYDLGQIYFLKSLNLYLLSKSENDYSNASRFAMKSIEYYEDISSSLELSESALIYNLCAKETNDEEYLLDDENEYISLWIEYVKNYIMELK